MDPELEQQDFAPPPERRLLLRGLPVAIVANVLLILALAASLDWKRAPDPSLAAIPLPPPAATPAEPTQAMGAPPAPPAAEAAAARRPPPRSR
ncbi:hypothetical protein PE066_12915 [Ramlibacter tataouinensis]|uniref:hypothetical protein n=1 Tax=Ramlibacter tataouinensis TaxID=94132 RepID=UPI0022F3F170|nr:hypothetical protein [Ramlibacter tataouinensis]WBY00374.1 hypothetical protein PE066_12915 [Ramlibacter tataouinensis]